MRQTKRCPSETTIFTENSRGNWYGTLQLFVGTIIIGSVIMAIVWLRKERKVGDGMDHGQDYVIEMLHITKEFPGIKANDDITLQLKRGEIHALLGENGAGKSTLMSILFGMYQPDAGEIRKNGEVVSIKDPNDATALGIGMVHQHFKLIDVFTVLDNIIPGAEDTK